MAIYAAWRLSQKLHYVVRSSVIFWFLQKWLLIAIIKTKMFSNHDLLPLWLGSRKGITPAQTTPAGTFQSISISCWKFKNGVSGMALGLMGTLVSLSQADLCILTIWLSFQTSSPRCQGLQFIVSQMISALSHLHCSMSGWGYGSRTRHCPCLQGVCNFVGK